MAGSTVVHGSTCHIVGTASPRQIVVAVYVGPDVTKGGSRRPGCYDCCRWIEMPQYMVDVDLDG